jgi:sulfur-oxidizing protein SoxA
VVSVNFMFRFSNRLVRATPYEFGSDAYIGLELYAAWRGQSLPVETPSIR